MGKIFMKQDVQETWSKRQDIQVAKRQDFQEARHPIGRTFKRLDAQDARCPRGRCQNG